MLLNVDQLQKQLDKDEFLRSWIRDSLLGGKQHGPEVHFNQVTLDYDSQMTDTYFVEYTGLQRQYERRKALGLTSTVQDDSSRSGNDTDADDADFDTHFMLKSQWLCLQ
ncbi:hypothetical protein Tco_1568158 [Tanacetum coccineum]